MLAGGAMGAGVLVVAIVAVAGLLAPATAAVPAAATTAAVTTIDGYARDGYRPLGVAEADLPYRDEAPAPRYDSGPHDEDGVRLFLWQGQLYDHPVAQAGYGFDNLVSYRNTGDRFFLDRAIAQARRNLDRRVVSRDAWWYPYPFEFSRCDGGTIQAPWYSAMAQGQLLSLFVWLYELTGDPEWRLAADRTFASLDLAPQLGVPWVSWVDPSGQLWLEEYPTSGTVQGERVFNGQILALFGVYDYWRITRAPAAVALFDGAATTMRRYVPTDQRLPQWLSRYSIGCPYSYANYHPLHVTLLLKLYSSTGAPVFARYADLLRDDYPPPAVAGTVRFAPGTHVGYRFDPAGRVVEQRSVVLSRISSAAADQRIRVYGRGIHYRMTNGVFAGYLVAEAYGERELLGVTARHDYTPSRLLTVQAGSYTGYRYDGSGQVVGERTVIFSRPSTAPVGASAWIDGRLCYLPTAGAFAGYWLPHTPGVAVAGTPGPTPEATGVTGSAAATTVRQRPGSGAA
ncbi:D-glucuronyl C5-epimerase family protein [Micromonospora cathayae]|uniref:D-glucuronyl C5-epimerase family protein n=1 Tax=Micromonospora cathayae TaxID=3028804 RepID=A0ABY7ZQI0_9ACTN|nr:D-glucuronyl C5-epimerase family protein [Micromonospora sp. HUAS 3]WDZ85202.1 D-glucuronyl C5-epimerase family protein [Micromonospora sp. HUAS 3]